MYCSRSFVLTAVVVEMVQSLFRKPNVIGSAWWDMHIATRHYDDRHLVIREWFDLEDRLYRISDREFTLLVAGEFPGDPPVEQLLSLPDVFAWYQDCPDQIERIVVNGDR